MLAVVETCEDRVLGVTIFENEDAALEHAIAISVESGAGPEESVRDLLEKFDHYLDGTYGIHITHASYGDKNVERGKADSSEAPG